MMITSGDKAPSFSLPTNNAGSLSVPTGKPLIMFFYPKDDTPGCTTEALEFTRLLPQFASLGVEIAGISPDSPAKHDKFTAKHDLKITLAADEEKKTLEAYGVWKEKKMYGRTFMGVVRSTFLLGPSGIVLESWPKVKVNGHAEAVLEAAKHHFG